MQQKQQIGAGRTSDASFVQIDHLTKRFDEVAAVDDVSIDIEKGEIFALLGSSGCGKSTLLRMLAGFETPTQGHVYLDGVDISTMPPYERPINMMFQSYALFPHLTVFQNIAFGLERDKMPKDKIAERVEAMLNIVQLKPYAKRKPHQLSGGQQQRVALARCLAKSPKLLLLDEPLGALDRKLREQTQFELVNIIKKVGVTCVMVTHDQEEAMIMADRIAVMQEGRFLQVGRPGEIYETPNCLFVAGFIGDVNLFKGTVEVDEADHVVIGSPECQHFVSHGITGTVGMEVSIALRPEKICLQETEPTLEDRELAAEHGHNCTRGTIDGVAYFGKFTLFHVRLDSGKVIKATRENVARHEDKQLVRGQSVFAWWDGSDVVVLTS
ncbi:polyamine ABC transporter ATP-binding protein [Rhodoferax sp.]|uniref:ABC transporter ATP-binding protein n=1 Tax=Rhodoferax sp. TaxID=50421 RepID=UPI0028410F10|nr:polyamine ABC transporter ATP-binding protein [Rhodoferax sp.]MDR3369952.1 polyamine ABC transporter ATP-binding protein [Rhodoferax sp.]